MNTILLTSNDVQGLIGNHVPKQRVESFFSLGISVSKIVSLNAGVPIVRAFSQLMEEWEYVHSGTAMQGVKFVMAKNSTCIYPQMSPIEGLADLARPSVYKFNNAVVYEHLQLPRIPYELDYAEVFIGLCGELSRLYEKLIHEECYSNQMIYDTIVRLDTRVKQQILTLVAKEVNDACSRKMKGGTRSLRELAGIQFTNTGIRATTDSSIAKAGSSNISLSSVGTSSVHSAGLRSSSPSLVGGGGSRNSAGIAAASPMRSIAVNKDSPEGARSSIGGRSGDAVKVENPLKATTGVRRPPTTTQQPSP